MKGAMAGRVRGRIPALGLWATAVALAAGALASAGCKGGSPPLDGNLLVITLDTTRADSLGVYGGEGDRTPHLDRLARGGVRFENCISPVPLTLPAHASLFTGRDPMAHQVRNNARYILPSEEMTLAERLGAAGFRTYAVIASYVLLGRFGLRQGFAEYDDSLDSTRVLSSYNTEIPADAVSGRFLAWLSKNKAERFFAWVHFYDPHEPYAPPAEFRTEPDDKDPKALYLGEVEFMDRHVGRILDGLRDLGLLSNTMIVAVGDHGEAFGEHGERGHAIFCYEENLRVPLIFSHEGRLPEGLVVEDRVGLIDVLPTILELYGLGSDKSIHGRSLVPFMRPGERSSAPRPLYVESLYGMEERGWAPLTGIIDGDLKFLSVPRPELYDLRRDPGERENLHDLRPDLAGPLMEKLAAIVSARTEVRSGAGRELTAEDIRQLRSLGYLASGPSGPGGGMDPKDGIVAEARLDDLFDGLLRDPSPDPGARIDRFLRESGIDRSPHFYSRLWRFHEKRRDPPDKIVAVLSEAAAAFPEDVGFRLQLVRFYTAMNKFDQVIPVCREILEREPENASAHVLMGNAFAALGDSGEAATSLEKALAIEPENISLRIRYAELLISLGRTAEALDMYDVLTAKENVLKDHDFLFKIALFYAKNGRDRKAAELVERCSRLHPSGRYFFFQAVFLSRLEDHEGAARAMRTALERYADELTPEQKAQAQKFLGSVSPLK
jgi:arylsulfatase A-like enzyme/tetratricopeptide (TPR) repeat protein